MSGTAALARPAPGDAPSRPASGTAPRDAAAASDPAPGAVTFRGASKRYGTAGPGRPALHGIDAVVPAGGVFGIIGRSGAGKSTLLRLINGLERPTGGQVLVDGQDVAGLDTAGLVALRRRIGMVFQHFNLLAAKTVFGNVALPLAVAGVDRAEIARRVGDMLALVGLEDKRDVHPSRLSGGQKQRVGIARALVGRPSILLCDEATSALDPDATLSILRLLKDVNRRLGITIVLITHEMSVIREICDRVLVLEAGVAVETGPVWRVFGEPRHDATRALLNPAGRGLPPDLEARLRPTAPAGRRGAALVAFGFTGRTEPDLADLVARLGGPLRLVHGGLDRVDGRSQGRLLVAVPLSPGGSLPDLTGLAQTQEVLGYVADDG